MSIMSPRYISFPALSRGYTIPFRTSSDNHLSLLSSTAKSLHLMNGHSVKVEVHTVVESAADKIKEIAKSHGIPFREDKVPLEDLSLLDLYQKIPPVL